jgi:7-cyano-7-deazaguanine synthase
MDSCVTAAIAARENEALAFFHASYGQRTENRELRAFHNIGDFYAVSLRLACSLAHLSRIGGSALTDPNIPLPEAKLHRTEIPASYVPFRNANMLSAAIAWSEVLHAPRIYVGAVEEDSSGYPDCREEFFQAFQKAANLGTRPETQIEIRTPLIHMTKAEIVKKGVGLSAPLHLSWSCYQGEDLACGQCDSCLLRLKGFREAGIPDPIPYGRE